MKRLFCLILALAMVLSLAACGKGRNNDYVNEPEEITLDMLKERTSTGNMLSYAGGFRADLRDDGSVSGSAYTTSMRFLYDGSYICANQLVDYDSGEFQYIFFSTNPMDATIYMENNEGVQTAVMDDRQLQNILEQTMFGLENYDSVIDECKETGNGFAVTVSCYSDEILNQKVEMNLDSKSGMVTDAVVHTYMDGAEVGVGQLTVTYGKNIEINYSPRDKAGAQTTAPQEPTDAEAAEATAPKTGAFTFATDDIDGNFLTYNDFADASMIMVHYFDPADADTVSKLPDLQKLYQDREKDGFLILAVIATDAADEDVKAIADEAGITFPILHMDNRLKTWYANQAPSTVFFDGNGDILTDEPYFGALSYENWETVLDEQLTGEEVDNTIVEMD